jgi:hypothetical protein
MVCPATDNPTSCKIRSFIRLLHVKNMGAAEIHRELCTIYGLNVINEGTVRQWCRMFKDGWVNISCDLFRAIPQIWQ